MTLRKIAYTATLLSLTLLLLSLASTGGNPKAAPAPSRPSNSDRQCVPVGGMLMTNFGAFGLILTLRWERPLGTFAVPSVERFSVCPNPARETPSSSVSNITGSPKPEMLCSLTQQQRLRCQSRPAYLQFLLTQCTLPGGPENSRERPAISPAPAR